jgi:xanthine dehydrogenase accessory factor
MRDFFQHVVEFIDAGRTFATAVVLDAEGSTPQETGVRALIDDTGTLYGTIGGGAAEAEALRQALEACRSGRPMIFSADMRHTYSRDAGAICGGRMRILLNPVLAKDKETYARVAEAQARRLPGALITRVWETGQTHTSLEWVDTESLHEGYPFPGAEAVRRCLSRERAELFVPESSSSAEGAALVEPIVPAPLLLIAGGGHVGQALARAVEPLGFDITVLDDRPEFAAPSRFPETVNTQCGVIAKMVDAFPGGSDVFIVLVTRGHKTDAEALEACIRKPAAYIGMMGSKRKIAMIRKDFIASGLATEQVFDRVVAPI